MRIIMTIMLFACMAFFPMNAATWADKEVTLTVSSDGVSKEEAIRNALRSAIEQTYGTFVSSNTTLVNNELAKDEIATISSGNIKKYKEVITETLPNGRVYVTLQATVSISKLVSYAKNKGATVEFDGASLAMNIQIEQLNTQSQDKVLENLAIQTRSLFYNAYDYSLKVEEIRNSERKNGQIEILLEVEASTNKNFDQAVALIRQTLKTLHVPLKQQVSTINYITLHTIVQEKSDVNSYPYKSEKNYTIRTSEGVTKWLKTMDEIINSSIINYTIQDGIGSHTVLEKKESREKFRNGEYYRPYYRLEREYHRLKGAWVGSDGFTIQKKGDMRESIVLSLESSAELSKYNDFKIQPKGE